MRRILRLICRAIGHDWAPPIPTGMDDFGVLYRTVCHRCNMQIGGGWDWMDEHKAWTGQRYH